MDAARTPTVLRAVPRTPRAWAGVDRRVRTVLAVLARDPGAPVATPAAVRAWPRLAAPLRAAQRRPAYEPGPCPDLCLVAVLPDDVDALGGLAAALGALRLPGADDAPLRRAAAATSATPAAVVQELARVHGVLDLDLGAEGELLYALAGVRVARTTGVAAAAHDAVAARVGAMWAAGEPYAGPAVGAVSRDG
ncbi:hypothetical protein [Pseudonocardia spirodelae]|uniref:Uncharacterized protein n=1 Tax=Pseudonocardia spirodelae TaxID=3133431 RepID=A0ABU8T7F9_9PSEU